MVTISCVKLFLHTLTSISIVGILMKAYAQQTQSI